MSVPTLTLIMYIMIIVLLQMLVSISLLTLTINSDIDSSRCTILNCPLGSQATSGKDSQSSASAPPWTSLGAKAGVKSGVWFRCVFSWFVLGGLSLDSHVCVCVCALFCKARCTCTCCLVLGDMFWLEDVSAMVFVNTCKCGTGLASMCLTCTTIYAMINVIALFRNTRWLLAQCFRAPPDILMMLALMCHMVL